MAVRRVVAAIDVVINGQRNLDRLSQGYVAVERAANSVIRTLTRVTTTTTSTHRSMQMLTGSVRNAGSAFATFVRHIDAGRTQLQQQGRVTRGLTDNILSLTKSMLLFSVLLPVVQLPQRAIESFADFVTVGKEWMNQMRAANALLNIQEENFAAYNRQVQQMAIDQGVATNQMGLFTAAASSVAAIKTNEQALAALGKEAYNASVALELATGSAKLARATFTDAAESQNTLIQVMSTYQFQMEELTAVSDSLFAITDVGNVRFSELENTLPRVTAAMGPMIQAATTVTEKQQIMNESFAAFAAMTQVMPADMAATSFANIFKDIAQMTGQQKALVASWERIRTAQGLGREMSLDPTALLENGPMAGLQQLRKILDIQSPLIDAYVANQRRLGNVGDEKALRVTGQMQIAQAYFEDMRAVRGFISTGPELYQQTGQAFEQSRQGGIQQGIQQAERSLADAQKRLGAAWTALRTQIFAPLEGPMITGANAIIAAFTRILDNVDFQNSSFTNKIRIVANSLMDSFTNYFRTGGRAEIATVGREIGTFIGDSITSFFRGGKDNVLVEAAGAFTEAFIAGIGQTLPAMLGAVLTSSITKAVAEAVAIRYVTKGRVPDAVSRTLAVGGAAAIENSEAMPGPLSMLLPAAGMAITAGAGLAALRRGSRANVFGAQGFMSNVGPIRNLREFGEMVQANAWTRAAFPRMGPKFPTSGPGWPGFARIAGMGGRVGGNALLGGLMAIPEILGAQNDRERWEAGGGAIGGIGGAAVGGLFGGGFASVLTGLGGSILGGSLGRAAGGGLYDLLHPGTGQGGVAEAEAPERLAMAEVFATGVDNSLAIPLLTNIRDVLVRSGGGSIGGFSSPAAGGVATTGAPTRSLASSFVNQMDTTQLTPAQASAACGPAAAAFFARAYGRNPTLKEAYSLVTAIQGGDPASSGGTRGVATLGTALNQMGVSNEVYQGANVDWGRLAEGSKAGQPGIVNVGPRGKFPGHFFQIGGWDPTSNRFNVGSSGTNLKGGKEWMTPEEMMALGPLLGAVYGGGTGKGGVTEADIASIQGTPGTGMGPGAAGSTVINVQNLMNVDRIDGNTDIKALMGQMAEMLRSLSSGGSVVGQSGVVAP